MSTTAFKRMSLELRIEAAAECLMNSPDLRYSEIELTPSMRLIRAVDAPDDMRKGTSTTCLPYIYRSEWFFLIASHIASDES